MKVTGFILTIGLVVLTGAASGQLTSNKETMFLKHPPQVAYYSEENAQHTADSRSPVGGPFEPHFLEEELCVEAWMASPFENVCVEEDIWIETWMTEPFTDYLGEEELFVESWMTGPFLLEEELVVEDWMTSPWN